MAHPDPGRLVLLALDEPIEPVGPAAVDSAHLLTCARCRAEVASLRAVAALAASAVGEQRLPPVPEAVWEGIEARAGLHPGTGPSPAAVAPVSPLGRAAHRAPRGRRRPRRGGRHPVVNALAAAAVGAAAAVATMTVATPDAHQVARVELAAQPAGPASAGGTVTFLDTGDGHLVARLDLVDVPPPDGLYQVWLYDGAATMIPLGVTTGPSVDLPVPPTVSLPAYPVVDVSVQRLGQQEHGVSILRGTLA